MMQRHCDTMFEHNREVEFSRNATFMEARRHFEEMCTGFYGIADSTTWHLQYADYFRSGLKKRSPTGSRYTFPCFQSAVDITHYFSSDSLVNFTTSPMMLGFGSSRSGKRKFLFDDDTRSVRSCTSSGQTRFARIHGDNSVDRVGPVLISARTVPVCDWPHHSRMLYSFEPSSRFMCYRTGRHSPFRESASYFSQSVPTEAFVTSSRVIYEPEAALVRMNSPYVPVHGRVVLSSASEYVESGSPTPRSAPYRMPRRRRRQRINRQRRLSHELLNQSLEYEEVGVDSQHGDTHLDVDDMSYEELLVLEDRIGNVKTGLCEDSIQKCLKMSKYSAPNGVPSVTSQKNEILCSICQEEYRENDELGLLVCGHSHHPTCIKQWLRLKNQCPICKAAAYSDC